MTGFDSRTFRTVLGHFPTGVTVVAAVEGGEPVGMVIGSFFSVSLEPPLVGLCADHGSSSWPRIRAAGSFCVSVLAADQQELSNRFATRGGDKFEGVGWQPAPVSGSPCLDGAVAWIDCELGEVHVAGDHDVAIGRVQALDVSRADAGPLLFFQGGYGRFER